MKPKAILTFDLEFWYNSNFLKKYLPKDKGLLEDFIKEPTESILDLLTRFNQRASFFVLGEVAKKYPDLIKKVFNLKHEIASHGYSHKTLNELNESELEKEIKLSKEIIKKITAKNPIGFRAPNFSLNLQTKWAIKIIKDNFHYDSSIHPLKRNFINREITEIPPSLGGIYFRILPLWLYYFLLGVFSKNKIPVLYFHPLDLFSFLPQIKSAPWWRKKIKYWGIKKSWKKFGKLMKKYNFISIEEYLEKNESSPR